MGLNSVSETEQNPELIRMAREALTRASQAKESSSEGDNKQLASNDTDYKVNSDYSSSKYQVPSRFGNNVPLAPSADNKIKSPSSQEWSGRGAEAVNVHNATADSGQKAGRDNLEAATHMLDGQLDNKDNTFVNFTDKSGKQYEAFRSKNATGTYYGFRSPEDKVWQDLKLAPVDHLELQKRLDRTHDKKLQDIDRAGTYENYKLNQKALGEINDLNDMHRDEKGEPKANLDSSRKEALLKLEALQSNAKELNSIKHEHPELISDLVINRFDKAAQIIGNDQLATEKQNLQNELTKLGAKVTEHGYDFSEVKDKATLIAKLDQANLAIDTKIDKVRNAAQRLDNSEQAEYTRISEEAKGIMKKLEAEHTKNPELLKLQERYKEVSGALDQDKGKYSLTQLRAFRSYLDSEGWTNKVQDSSRKLSEEATDKVAIKVFANNEEAKLVESLKAMPNNSRLHAQRIDGSTINFYTKINGNIYRDNGSFYAEKLNPKTYMPYQSDTRFIIQQQEQHSGYEAYRVDSRNASSRIIPYYDEQSKLTKVFAVNEDSGNKKYQEIQAMRVDRANIDAYQIKDGIEDKYYIVPKDAANKNSLWELKLASGQYGLISASQGNYRPDGARTTIVDGLNFSFDQNGNLIGLAVPPSRAQGLVYESGQLNEARKKAFLD